MSIDHFPGTSMVEPPGTETELGSIFSKLADDVAARERELDLPIDAPHGIAASLRRVHDSWKTGERTTRTGPAIAVFDRLVEGGLSRELVVHLSALDGMINAFDDLIDSRTSGPDQRVGHAVVAAMSGLLAAQTVPTDADDRPVDIQYHQWIELAQIPTVERELLREIHLATDAPDRVELATAIYQYRARDIRAFGEIPAAVHDLDADLESRVGPDLGSCGLSDLGSRVVADLQCFRARYLLFEDLRHVARDIREGHENPAMALVRTGESRSKVASHVEQIYDAFTYSPVGQEFYGTVLQSLERRPADLSGEISAVSDTLAQSR